MSEQERINTAATELLKSRSEPVPIDEFLEGVAHAACASEADIVAELVSPWSLFHVDFGKGVITLTENRELVDH